MRGQQIKSSWNSPAIRVLSEDPFRQWWLGFHYTESVTGSVTLGGVATESVTEGSSTYNESMSGGAKASGTAKKSSTKRWTGASTSWNTAGNWTPSGVPGIEDDVLFSTGSQNCTLNIAMYIGSLTSTSGYTGTLDLADSGYSHNVFGDCTLANTSFDLGNSTLTVAGNFDNRSLTTFTPGTSTLVLTGQNKTIYSIYDVPTTRRWYNVTFAEGSSYTIGGVNTLRVLNNLTINGPVNVSPTLDAYNTARVYFGAAGAVSGNLFSLTDCQVGYGLMTFPATAHITVTTFNIGVGWGGNLTFPPGTYEAGTTTFSNASSSSGTKTLEFVSGTYAFTGNVVWSNTNVNGGLAISNVNNPSFEYQKNLTFTWTAGTMTYTKGTGSTTLSGGNNQVLTLLGFALEPVTRSKSGGYVTWMSDPVYGKARLNGSAVVSYVGYSPDVYNEIMMGGARLSGSSVTALHHTQSVGGGAKSSGIATLARLLYQSVSGGIKTAGTSTNAFRFNPGASGGIEVVGVSPSAFYYGRPNEDIYTGTKFTTSPPFWSRLDDVTIDGEHVVITLPFRETDYCILGFDNTTKPTAVNIRISLNSLISIDVDLYCGITFISHLWKFVGGGAALYTKTLTADEIAAITDPTDVRLRIEFEGKSLSLQTGYLYWISMDCASSASEMATIQVNYNPAVSGGAELDGTPDVLGIGSHAMRAYTYTEPLLNTNIGQIIQRLESKTELELKVTAALHVQ